MSEPETLPTCRHCGAPFDGSNDFCLECAQPVTDAGRRLQRDDQRGCAFFVFLTFALLFATAAGSGIFLSTCSDALADPNLRKLLVPGYICLVLSVACVVGLFRVAALNRKTRSEEHEPDTDAR